MEDVTKSDKIELSSNIQDSRDKDNFNELSQQNILDAFCKENTWNLIEMREKALKLRH